jgi:hypothetical protein
VGTAGVSSACQAEPWNTRAASLPVVRGGNSLLVMASDGGGRRAARADWLLFYLPLEALRVEGGVGPSTSDRVGDRAGTVGNDPAGAGAIGVANHAEIFRKALWSNHGWDAFRAFAASTAARSSRTGAGRTTRSCVSRSPSTSSSSASRGATPRPSGLDWIDKRFGRRPRYSLRNAPRLQLVLALVRAFHAGQADLATFEARSPVAARQGPNGSERSDSPTVLASQGRLPLDM